MNERQNNNILKCVNNKSEHEGLDLSLKRHKSLRTWKDLVGGSF
jgi:hypothetical protein